MNGQGSARETAGRIAAGLGYAVSRLSRMSTGLCHHVFEAELADGGSVVIRLGRRETSDAIRGGVGWHGRLAAVGVPVPALLHFALDEEHPYVILERLPGRDLLFELPEMSDAQVRALAREIAGMQAGVATLPRASGFGFAREYGDRSLAPSWRDVVLRGLDRSRSRLESTRAADPGVVDAVIGRLPAFATYLRRVEPIAFLDDATTKNVIVDRGRLSGIVDTDAVCFGDPLYALGLTRIALLSEGLPTTYADAWADALSLDDAARAAIELYVAVFCVDFLSELGQCFSRDEPQPADPARSTLLLRILDEQLLRIDALAGTPP